MASNDTQSNAWFGVAMFLFGLIAGAVLTFATGTKSMFTNGGSVPTPSAPTAPSQPTAPMASAKARMTAYAEEVGVDTDKFTACLDSGKYKAKVSDQQAGGEKAGVSGTPGNVIVNMKTKKARLISGARPFASFQAEIDDLIANPSSDSKDPSVTAVTNLPAIDFAVDHYMGDKTAEIALVEYNDYQCPFCHRVHPTIKQVMEQYDGKVVWVLRHFPLYSIHPDAELMAAGAECAKELGGADAFWEYTDKVMAE